MADDTEETEKKKQKTWNTENKKKHQHQLKMIASPQIEHTVHIWNQLILTKLTGVCKYGRSDVTGRPIFFWTSRPFKLNTNQNIYFVGGLQKSI